MPADHNRRQPVTRPQQTWQGHIERLGWGGVGVGRLDDGRIVLLKSPLALFPGEEVRAEVELHSRHAEGVVTEWIQRDSRREAAGCTVADMCGGCSLWGAGAALAELKWSMVQDLLDRQLREAPQCHWLPAPAGTVRSRIQLGWDGAELGFYRAGSTELVAVSGCPLAAAPVSAAIPALRDALGAGRLPARPDRWELATGTPALDVAATSADLAATSWRMQGGAWIENSTPLNHQLGRYRMTQTPGTFFQVCPEWGWQAFGEVLRAWDLRGTRLFDLYGGSGFFTMLLAERFGESVVVESNPDSCTDAETTFQNNSARIRELKVSVECSDVSAWLPAGLGEPGDVVLLDPPRSGLPQDVALKLLTARAQAIVLVGCDGMALCRDIKRLAPAWQLSKLAAIDLFPNTPQAEFIGLLQRGPAG